MLVNNEAAHYFIYFKTNNIYNQNSSIKFETERINSSLCHYSNALILVTGNITVDSSNNTVVDTQANTNAYSDPSKGLW